jgi:hypothetical protein
VLRDRLLIVLAGGAVLLGSPGCAVPTRSVEEREWQAPSLRELLPAALDAAIEWRPDAHLVSAMVLGRPEPQVEFIMGSMATPDVGLLVYVDDPMGTPSIRLVEVAAPGRLEARPELELSSWGVLDSPEAFQLGTASGYGGVAGPNGLPSGSRGRRPGLAGHVRRCA